MFIIIFLNIFLIYIFVRNSLITHESRRSRRTQHEAHRISTVHPESRYIMDDIEMTFPSFATLRYSEPNTVA